MIYGVDVDEDDHDDDKMKMIIMKMMMVVVVVLLWRNSWMSGLPESGQVYEAGGDHRTAPHRSKHERTTALEAQRTKHYTKTHSAKNMQ